MKTHPMPGKGTKQRWNERVFYQVFVRSFQDSDGDGIGDLDSLPAGTHVVYDLLSNVKETKLTVDEKGGCQAYAPFSTQQPAELCPAAAE